MRLSQKKYLIFIMPLSIALSFSIYFYINRPTEPDKTEIELYFRAANAYDEGNLELCISMTDSLSKGNPVFFQARLLNAKALFFSDRFEQSEDVLRRLIKDYENYTEAEVWLLRSMIQLDDSAAAERFGEDLLSRSPEDPRVLGLMARTAYVRGNYQKALEYYSRAILFEEELAINRLEIAKIYSSLMNPDMARFHLRRSLLLLSDESPLKPGIIQLLNTENAGNSESGDYK